jgi:hypothetical protein
VVDGQPAPVGDVGGVFFDVAGRLAVINLFGAYAYDDNRPLRVHRSQAARRVEIQPLGRGNRPKTTARRAVKTHSSGQKPGPALVSRTSRAASMLGMVVGP